LNGAKPLEVKTWMLGIRSFRIQAMGVLQLQAVSSPTNSLNIISYIWIGKLDSDCNKTLFIPGFFL